jgi:hypothetical protein
MSGRNARGLRKLSEGSRLKYRFAKKIFKRFHMNHTDIRRTLDDQATE